MQHTITTSKGKWLLVEVPKESTDHMIGVHGDVLIYYYKHANEQENLTPKIKHELISTTSTITEDQAAEIVESVERWGVHGLAYENYSNPIRYSKTAIESFASLLYANLLHANQIPTEKVYVIIKIKE